MERVYRRVNLITHQEINVNTWFLTLGTYGASECETDRKREVRERDEIERTPPWDWVFSVTPRQVDLLDEAVAGVRFGENVVPQGARWFITVDHLFDGGSFITLRDKTGDMISTLRPRQTARVFLLSLRKFLKNGNMRVLFERRSLPREEVSLPHLFKKRGVRDVEKLMNDLRAHEADIVRIWHFSGHEPEVEALNLERGTEYDPGKGA